ncbi:MAG: hypothetical protein WCC64_13695 [Aliidongia sp.]
MHAFSRRRTDAGSPAQTGMMGKVLLGAALVGIVILLGGGAFLAFWDIPAPSVKVEKVLPDARFQK